ncbi:hypothetical protein UJ101_00412 [Flavobacteriaceae bacterium UJ101]|nr:hypothetical protein UJ101_00412 [Flavobacteriaceae bacterium UJ101]
MKTTKYKYFKIKFFLFSFVLITFISCDREASEKTTFASFTNNPEVFIDTFSSGLDYYPFGDSYFEAFEVDERDKYAGDASMRFDIPNFGEGYGGAIFRDDNGGRNLTEYNALTFWAKGTKGTTIDQIGFGQDFGENKYQVTVNNLAITTGWKQYVIPIPDASKLVDEQGLFWYATGATENNTEGFSFWVDELKFENLKTIGQPRPAILSGEDITQSAVLEQEITLTGLTETFNLESGDDLTMTVPPSYYTFTSSNIDVAVVNESGIITVTGEGTAIITASIAGTTATGSLTINSQGELVAAPIPTQAAENVISIFSNSYTNGVESNFDPRFGGSTTQVSEGTIDGNSFLTYSDNNFTGIIFNNTIDASDFSFLHIDVFVTDSGTEVGLQIRDIGTNQEIETDTNNGNAIGDDKDYRTTLTDLTVGEWKSFDIPLTGDLETQRNNLGAIILTGGPNFILDNIYFYKE